MSRRSFVVPTGTVSARIHGAYNTLLEKNHSAYDAAFLATDEREAAMLRGKSHAYAEAALLLQAIEVGHRLPWSRGRAARRRAKKGEVQ